VEGASKGGGPAPVLAFQRLDQNGGGRRSAGRRSPQLTGTLTVVAGRLCRLEPNSDPAEIGHVSCKGDGLAVRACREIEVKPRGCPGPTFGPPVDPQSSRLVPTLGFEPRAY
jgi:hypothetical protein